MKNFKLLGFLLLLNLGSFLIGHEKDLTAKKDYLGKPLFPEEVVEKPAFRVFLEIYNQGTKEEKLQFLDVSLLPNARQQEYQQCPNWLSRIVRKQTKEEEAQCREARIKLLALELLRNGINNGLGLDISAYRINS